jgi:CRISPR/Cas system CSM-associated protein Csm3 (group 7 of RAMP superfamily)
MTRKSGGYVQAEGRLVAQAPVSVGGVGGSEISDIELAVDGMGRYCIPGTSIKGALRALAEDLSKSLPGGDNGILGKVFGDAGNEGNEGASRLIVHDAPVEFPQEPSVEVREGISINAESGTAERGFLYSRSVLPKGTTFSFRMEMELTENNHEKKDFLELFGLLLESLSRGRVFLGARSGSGLGAVRFEKEPDIRVYDFDEDGAFEAWLDPPADGSPFSRRIDNLIGDTGACHQEMLLSTTVSWEPEYAVMVKAGYEGIDADILPLTTMIIEEGSNQENVGTRSVPVIPGSSIRGAFRARAQMIVNSLEGHAVEGEKGTLQSLLDKMFGTKERKGRIRFSDVRLLDRGGKGFADADTGKWLAEDEGTLDDLTERSDHVAICRFTGGAAEGKLYSARRPKGDYPWEPIKIELLSLDNDKENDLARVLMVALLKDLKNGRIPIGFGTRRGLGDIRIRDTRFDPPISEETRKRAAEIWRNLFENTF